MTRTLVTSALPYANGPIHLGHLVEYILTDIWVRAARLRQVGQVVYVCADDTHGTAITMRARKEGRTEVEVIDEMNAAHQRDFAAFQIVFDHYGSTHSKENEQYASFIWKKFVERGAVERGSVAQLFDPEAKLFLADRFVKGECPVCGSPDQYGDNCEKCSATYDATELKNPRSTLSNATPVLAESEHLFVGIESERAWLTEFTQAEGRMPRETANYLAGFFLGQPLRRWDVSRPAPYFGFGIPDEPGQHFYVWFDAPIGYIAATAQWCALRGESFDRWWRADSTDPVEIVHVIGKDIVKFHTLFWPVMLKTAGFTLPSRIQVHGFLTVNGAKMSKSKGTFIDASTYLQHLDPAYLRYYYATKLGPRPDDLDLNLEEFALRVNAELVNKIVNLASRTSRFLGKTGFASRYPADGGLFERGAELRTAVADAYKSWDFARVTRLVTELADRANEFVDKAQPWALAKDPTKADEVQNACSIALNLFRQIVIYLAPVVPKLAAESAELLSSPITSFDDAAKPLEGTPVGTYQHLMKRLDPKQLTDLVAASTQADAQAPDGAQAAPPAQKGASSAKKSKDAAKPDLPPLEAEPLAATIGIDDFTKVDLRVAEIVSAEAVPEAKKLLKLTISLGADVRKTVYAGIKAYYEPEKLVGRLVIVCANLAPRTMKIGSATGVSEAMVLAAGAGNEAFLLSPDSGAKPGQRVH
ncbi:MAG: methionine--tRNA ligase [Polyangiaceae bacterium]